MISLQCIVMLAYTTFNFKKVFVNVEMYTN